MNRGNILIETLIFFTVVLIVVSGVNLLTCNFKHLFIENQDALYENAWK